MPAASMAVARAVLCAAMTLVAATAHAGDVRLRIAWGGGTEHAWRGTISVSDGSISEPQPLGTEADEPGSMWLENNPKGDGGTLVVQQHSPHGYDGVDVLVTATSSSKLVVNLSAAGQSDHPTTIEIPLADLASEFVNKELDNRGNRLLLMRTPGDSLRVALDRDNLVFAPGETLKCTLTPHALSLPDGGQARIKVQLLSGGKELWSKQHDVQAGREKEIPLEIALPNEEGVYDVVISAINNPNWSQAVRQPLNWKRTIAERHVQLLVLDPRGPSAARNDGEFTQIVEKYTGIVAGLK